MKGVAVVAAVVVFLSGLGLGNPPTEEQIPFEQLSNDLKVTGSGEIQMTTTMVDRRIALDYFNALDGDGDLDMNSERMLSDKAYRAERDIGSNNSSRLNLFENSRIVYSGVMPLTGKKLMKSKLIFGGIGASVGELFSTKEMEADLKSSLGATPTATNAYTVGMDTESGFEGFWITETKWHKILNEDIDEPCLPPLDDVYREQYQESHRESHKESRREPCRELSRPPSVQSAHPLSVESALALYGKFHMDKQVELRKRAASKSYLNCSKTPSVVTIREGDAVLYEYRVLNSGDTEISDIRLDDSDLGTISLNRTTLPPGQTAYGAKEYNVTEQDILGGRRETTATSSGTDSLGEVITSTCRAALVPAVETLVSEDISR